MNNSFDVPSASKQPFIDSQDHDMKKGENDQKGNGQMEPGSSMEKQCKPTQIKEGSQSIIRKKPKKVIFTPDRSESSQRNNHSPANHHQKSQHLIVTIFDQEPMTTPANDFTEAAALPVTSVESAEAGHPPQTDVSAPYLKQEHHLVPYAQQRNASSPLADVMTLPVPSVKPVFTKGDPTDIAGMMTAKTPTPGRLPQNSNAKGRLSPPPLTPIPEMQTITQVIQTISQKMRAIGAKLPFCVEKVKVMNTKKQRAYRVLVVVWIIVNLYFWTWWLQPGHLGNPLLFVLMNLAFLYESTVLPSFYAFYLGQMRRPQSVTVDAAEKMDVVKKVAVISLTVPGSESLEMVKQQMIAMTHMSYPHDSWILVDKHHSPEIETLARELGVLYFSRHDVVRWGESQVKHWNQSDPPFKAKTKAGNVNSWIDAYGHHYSHFTQLDIDHKPIRCYLQKVLGFFLDKKVKWVQAPSVYGNVESWTARGSAEQEFVLQGPLQMGFYGFCNTPFIIGSHCTYDMEAIREIGGFQPTRAEDHLDTVCLATRGYEGVFLPEVIAIGDGPETFETYLAQQFAWAYSMMQVLFNFTPKCMKNYTLRQALQFLFVQTWYIFWSLSMFMLFILPVISLFLNVPIARVSYGDFLLHSLPMAVAALMIWAWSHPWHFPEKLEFSWRGMILHIARWPIVLSALVQVILRVQKPYMITVKGLHRGTQRPFSLRPHYPYLALIAISLGACWFYLLTVGQSNAQGYLVFALQGAAILLSVYITALVKDIKDMMQDGISFGSILLVRANPLMLLVSIISLFIWTACISWNGIYAALIIYGNS